MNNNTEHIKDHILEKIRTDKVHMHSKLYLALKLAALFLAVFGLLVTSSLLISYVIFSLNISDRFILLGFGERGIRAFLKLFPWHLLLIEILLIIILERIVRQFRWGYRSPLLWLLLGIIMISSICSIIVTYSALHEKLLNQNTPFKNLYRDIEKPSGRRDIFHGQIIEMQGYTLLVADLDHSPKNTPEKVKVQLSEPIVMLGQFHIGDFVFIAGEWDNGEFIAYGIRKMQPKIHFQLNIVK